jgi:phosphoglycolate phosphatase
MSGTLRIHPATIRAVLFDKDGTLVDFDATWGPAAHAVMRHLADGDEAALRRLMVASHFELDTMTFRATSPLLAGAASQYGPAWAQALNRPATPAFFAEIDILFRDAGLASLKPIGDPRALCAALAGRGYRLGIATNDSQAGGEVQAEALGLTPYMTAVIGWDSGYGAKPDPGPVLGFARAAGVAPSQVAMVGDTGHDLDAARAAGALAVLVLTGPRGQGARDDLAPQADLVLDSAADLAGWLAEQPDALLDGQLG